MKIPCEECLILPICKSKPIIRCDILYNAEGSHKDVFDRAKEILPKLWGIQYSNMMVSSTEPHYRRIVDRDSSM